MSTLGGDRTRLTTPPVDTAQPRPTMLSDQLPRVLAQDQFIHSYVDLCDEIWASVLERIDHLEWFLDVGVAPIAFVRWLGTWLGVTVDASHPEDRQRALVRTAGRTLMWRGTRYGLVQLLSALTGTTVDVVDDGGVTASDDPARASQRLSVRLSSSGGLTEAYLLEIIRGEIPANAVVDISIDEEPLDLAQPDEDDPAQSVLAEPQPHGDEGFLPPMRGRLDDEPDE